MIRIGKWLEYILLNLLWVTYGSHSAILTVLEWLTDTANSFVSTQKQWLNTIRHASTNFFPWLCVNSASNGKTSILGDLELVGRIFQFSSVGVAYTVVHASRHSPPYRNDLPNPPFGPVCQNGGRILRNLGLYPRLIHLSTIFLFLPLVSSAPRVSASSQYFVPSVVSPVRVAVLGFSPRAINCVCGLICGVRPMV